MTQVTLHGRIRKKLLLFKYAGYMFGARRIGKRWWVFIDGMYIGVTAENGLPFQLAYDYLNEHPELMAS
jgi:hypothetical protein